MKIAPQMLKHARMKSGKPVSDIVYDLNVKSKMRLISDDYLTVDNWFHMEHGDVVVTNKTIIELIAEVLGVTTCKIAIGR
jgi:hypothetical protein